MNKRLLPEKRISEFFPNANTKKKKVERSKIPKNVKDFLSEIVHVEKLLHTNSDANIFNFNDETEKKYKKKNSKRGRKKTPHNSVIYRVPSPELISTKNIDNTLHSIEPFPSSLISISPKLITRSPSKPPSTSSSSSSSSSSGSYSPFRKLSKETLRKIVKEKKKISHKPKGLTWEQVVLKNGEVIEMEEENSHSNKITTIRTLTSLQTHKINDDFDDLFKVVYYIFI